MWLTILDKPNVNEYDIHQMLWCFFQEHQKQGLERPFCYRVTDNEIVMLSNVKPSTECKKIELVEGNTYLFECRASIKRTYKDANGKSRWREDYKGDELKEWFKRRFGGAATVNFVAYKSFAPHVIVRPKTQQKMVFSQYVFQGSLTVTNSAELEKMIGKGIGQGCAFGFGAVLLLQVMK